MSYADLVVQDGPAGYWRLDEASGSAIDSSGNAHSLAVGGGAPGSIAGLLIGDLDLARSFGGSDWFRGAGSTISPAAGGVHSWEAWCKPSSSSAQMDIASKWGGAPSSSMIALVSSVPTFYTYDGAAAGVLGASTVANGTIAHIVATYDGTNGRLYLNGALIAGPTAMNVPQISSCDLEIGYKTDGTGVEEFHGTVDEVAYYKTVLSAARVLAHYNEGAIRGGLVVG